MRRPLLVAVVVVATFVALDARQTPVPQPPGQPTPGQPTPGQPAPGRPTPGQPAPGQPSPTTPRTPARAGRVDDPQKGTAVLRGVVVAADSGNPLRRAMVRAMSQDGRGNGMATSDADGRFEIRELIAGRYTVSASKAGYVTMSHGQRRAEQPGTVLDVLDGQRVEKITIALPRGGVITGRITDEFGEPIAQAQVQAMRMRYSGGARRLTPSGGASTDDLGAFRIYGLTPADYYVNATVRSNAMMSPMTTAGSVELEGFAPTYYPGTPNAGEAQRITVRVGQETAGVSFALAATRLSQIRGRVTSSSGEPVGGAMIMAQNADRSSLGMMMSSSGQTRPDGTFQINGLTPGIYALSVRPRSGRMDENTEFGLARVAVGGDDVDNVLIMMSRGAVARGIITTDEGIALPVQPQQVSIAARPLDPDMTPFVVGGGPPKVNDDWTFEIPGLSDRRVISGFPGGPDWVLKAVLLNGVDITDAGADFVPGQVVEGFEIVFTRKRTELSGALTNDRGEPVLDATVLAFSQDPRQWAYLSRYLRVVRPDQSGRYQLRGLPPADYFVIALTDLEAGRQQDPEFLDQLREFATRVSLEEAETEVQNLRVVRSPQ